MSGSIDTSLSLDTVWGVITDYERLSEVYSNIQHSRFQHQAGKLCVVQASGSLHALQSTPLVGAYHGSSCSSTHTCHTSHAVT